MGRPLASILVETWSGWRGLSGSGGRVLYLLRCLRAVRRVAGESARAKIQERRENGREKENLV